ncbi:hypothetical protein CGMCC3_g11788 [Colletotrichum fructicola]|uniref:Uncharacterized protein n=1 Tax=Colletotrichum fructicola (strain Nara gc5) TaxID=1213859 RepID=A0A7J6IVZ3_COLFN|nr:uncharacterized protein CGMCC3_g11788 [Colletotrichum fructicola]KAE9572156.1 hypothetical protein CGMCC3_g11788 [Colletotrichum fructicola]KAF4432536.1 hypothetical protein CFRS1_v013606 [Colletotrichum fructicola]KAF4480656.1 hypothetical protein CGGC5_v010479 [Colletotrichum fructicola Nara gc5]
MPTHHPLCIITIPGNPSSLKALLQRVHFRRAGQVGLVQVTPIQHLLSNIITAELPLQFIGLASTSVPFLYRKRKTSNVPSITHPHLFKGLPRR